MGLELWMAERKKRPLDPGGGAAEAGVLGKSVGLKLEIGGVGVGVGFGPERKELKSDCPVGTAGAGDKGSGGVIESVLVEFWSFIGSLTLTRNCY